MAPMAHLAHGKLLRILIASLAILWGAAQVQGQDYPFFVQPLSVEDLDAVANAVELSPIQRLELLEAHATYLDDLEELQNGRMKRFVDSGIGLVSDFEPWGGKFTIPPRRDIDEVIREGRSIYAAFGDLDDDFFDRIAPIMSDEQSLRFELARKVRAVERYRLVFLQAAGGINSPAGIHLIAGLLANDVRLTPDMVHVLVDHQERLLNLTMAFERSCFTAADKVLDWVDDNGLRDMEQRDMMVAFMEGERLAELSVFFDAVSEPVQRAAARIGSENVRAWRELQPLLVDQSVRFDLDRRVVKTGWRRLRRGVYAADARFAKVLDLLPPDDLRRLDAQVGQERLRSGFQSLLVEYIPVAAKRDTFRTAAMLQSKGTFDGQAHIDAILRRREALVDQAEALLTVLEVDLIAQDESKEQSGKGGSGAGKGGGGSDGKAALAKLDPTPADLPLAPLEVERLQSMLQWVNADNEAVSLVGVLHMDYYAACTGLARTSAEATKAIDDDETLTDWRMKRRAKRTHREQVMEDMQALENTLFGDLEVGIDNETVRLRLADVRGAFERARQRQAMAREDWSLRSQPESIIDLTVLVLGQDPATLTAEQRADVLEQVIGADRQAEGTLAELGDLIERVQLLESRMYGREASELDADVQEQIRASWQQRREKVGKSAKVLAQINRDGSDAIAQAMGPLEAEVFRDAYRREAFPDLFEGEDQVGKAFSEALALVSLGDDQRRRVQDLQIRHVSTWSALTDELIRLRADNDIQINSWPPSGESMHLAMRNEQLRYRRGQVAARSLAELAVLLEPEQRTMVPELQKSKRSGRRGGRGGRSL